MRFLPRKCCFCFPLRFGVITVAIIYLIMALSFFFMVLSLLIYYIYEGEEFSYMMKYEIVVYLLVSFVLVAGSAFLLLGSYKRVQRFVCPWVFVAFLTIIIIITQGISYAMALELASCIACSIITGTYVVVTIYLCVVVYSFYESLESPVTIA